MVVERARSAVLENHDSIVMREFPTPKVHEDDALLEVERAGICHTDVDLLHGTVRYAELPLILGHEITGRIAEIGPVASRRWGVSEGDRVAVEAMVRCGFCRPCIEGNYRYCKGGIGYGTFISAANPPHLWGSYGQYMYLAPGSLVYKLPDNISADLAILLNVAISNAIQWTIKQGGVRLGDAVVIQGVGPIGLSCIAVAREAGADCVIATGLSADGYRLEMAASFGASAVIDVEREEVVARVKELTGGDMADVVIDVTGSGQAVRKSLELVRTMGTVVNAGVTGDETLSPIPLDTVLYKEIRLQGVFTNDNWSMRRAIKLARRHKYPFESLVTHRFPLEKAQEAVLTAGRELPDVSPVKVTIAPNGI